MTDNELITRVLAGDATAERTLYDAHVDRVFRLAYRLAGDAHLAQDFTQETFVRAFDKLREFQGRSALATWLHAITVSVSLNGLRKAKKLRQREVEIDDAEPAFLITPAADDPNVAALLEDLELIIAQIARLSVPSTVEGEIIRDGMNKTAVLPRVRATQPSAGT